MIGVCVNCGLSWETCSSFAFATCCRWCRHPPTGGDDGDREEVLDHAEVMP